MMDSANRSRRLAQLGCITLAFAAAVCYPTGAARELPAAADKPLQVIVTQSGIDPAQREQIEFPEPEPVSLNTPDGVSISATFYGGVLGKKTPVLILLHDLAGASAELNELGLWLQTNYGYASIVPDLRGHGKSILSDQPDLKLDKLSAAQFASIGNDIEACKRFLRDQKNDEGLLNIDMLTIAAVGKSNVLAVEWSKTDWSFPRLNGKKQGEDVKQLVMISPEDSYKSVKMTALKEPLFTGRDFETPLSVWLVHDSNDEKQTREVDAMQTALVKGRDKEGTTGVYVAAYEASGAAIANLDAFRTGLGEFVYFKLYKDNNKFPWEVRGTK